jgi:hypothetical protein
VNQARLACVSAKNLSISTLETRRHRSALDGLSRPRFARRTTDMYETPKIPAVSRRENASLGTAGSAFCAFCFSSATTFFFGIQTFLYLPRRLEKQNGHDWFNPVVSFQPGIPGIKSIAV